MTMTPKELKELRKNLNMTQKQFGQAIGGITYVQVGRYEQGITEFPAYRMPYIEKLKEKLPKK